MWIRRRLLVACIAVLIVSVPAVAQSPVPAAAQAGEIYLYTLAQLGEHVPAWSEADREAVARGSEAATLASFPDGIPDEKLDSVVRLVQGMTTSRWRRATPECLASTTAVTAHIMNSIAQQRELTAPEAELRDSQYQELAEMLRAAISDVYPEFVAPMADFDEATVVAELGLYSQACSDTFLERARSDALAPSVSGLKRPLTDEEMAQAEEWVIERVTTTPDHRLRAWGRPDTTMPDHGPAVRRVWGARATPRNTVYRSLHSRADMVGGGLLMQLNVMTGGPFPPEVEALRDAAAASLRALRN